MKSGDRWEGDILVGADGIHSKVHINAVEAVQIRLLQAWNQLDFTQLHCASHCLDLPLASIVKAGVTCSLCAQLLSLHLLKRLFQTF